MNSFGICVAVVLAASTVSGCVYYGTHTAEKGRPLSTEAVHQIIIGKTTRTDILKTFGPPHSIFQGQGELLTAERIGWYRYVETRLVSSIDEQHYAMLYRFGTSSASSLVVLVAGTSQASIQADELLIFLNKASNVVSDVAYRNDTGKR